MKQLLQSFKDGAITIVDAPAPEATNGKILINTNFSLISIGTEKMLVEFGKASYLNKVRQQPEKAKMVWDKIKTNGLLSTLDSVRAKLNDPIPLGYSNVGVVAEVGDGVKNFKPGDRVVSNGAHADVVTISENLCAKIPNEVDDETAAFTVVASIGLQGIRLIQPTLGESVVVIGAGLIGLLTIQLLHAHGCRVLALDVDEQKLALAEKFGASVHLVSDDEEAIDAGFAFSDGCGVDAVIITASTKSSSPISQAARMSRKRGRIVLVGVTGLEFNRSEFYEKELTFQVSCSYGPGRYDKNYEQQGLDYPIGYVRWTEQRNFMAVLHMMAKGVLNVKPLITHKFLFTESQKAYQILDSDKQALGIILKYDTQPTLRHEKVVIINASYETYFKDKPVIGVLGAGNYASRVLIPAFKNAKVNLHTIVSEGGLHGAVCGRKQGFLRSSSKAQDVFANKEINTVVIATRHNSHARFVIDAINAGKNAFVEKPLALNIEELSAIEAAYHSMMLQKSIHLMVGFNRRFSSQIKIMHDLLRPINEPKTVIITVNAGHISQENWIQDRHIGGGRILGEACHFIDLLRFLIGAEIIAKTVNCIGNYPGLEVRDDKATITLGFVDGSLGTIHYFANGSPKFQKERIEVFTKGRILQLNNFRKLKAYGWPNFSGKNLFKQDKGQKECVHQFVSAISAGLEPVIPIKELFEVARVNIEIADMLANL